MTLKQKIHARYTQMAKDKIDVFRDRISALSQDSQNDAKGSAGDKHETALSMMQLEQEKLSYKLRECIEEKEFLSRIDPSVVNSRVGVGSLVKASGKYLYICRALPKITIEDKVIFALSLQSPLGKELLGLKTGENCEINGSKYVIEKIE